MRTSTLQLHTERKLDIIDMQDRQFAFGDKKKYTVYIADCLAGENFRELFENRFLQ